jgi:asparagine synthase (glutamine-hydrolysing)
MCGIVGAIKLQGTSTWRLSPDVCARMMATLSYRGPDGTGDWTSPDANCWLGHTRLAIIDRAGGHQPMANEDGSVVLTFNGEIYNHLDLHQDLAAAGHRFESRCDTESLVHGYEQWGARGLVERARGMFAIALYDSKTRTFLLARDRVGIKPLYYAVVDGVLVFASEIKAILAYPGVARDVDREALTQCLTFRYVPSPLTMFKGIAKLPAGHFLEFRVDGGEIPKPTRFWDLSFKRSDVPFDEALERVDQLLEGAVDSHLMSDVPLGAQLSGGVDSSLIVAHMERLRQRNGHKDRVRTFSIGFDADGFSELPDARQVAERYGTEHHEVIVGFEDFTREFARLCWVYDEPVSEPAAIPTYLLCRFARQHVTVMLTGEGGDELFGGYPKCAVDQYGRYLNWMPAGLRRAALRGVASLMPFRKRRARIALENLSIADEAQRLASWFSGFDDLGVAQLVQPGALDGRGAAERLRDDLARCDSRHPLDRMLYADLHTWLVDDLLIKGDRMSMASSVEARVPFLDHPLVEYAASLPPAYKAKGAGTKIILKKLAERYIPRETIYRRKVGFTVPLTPWFRGPLRGFVREVVLGERALARGYFRPDVLKRLVDDHLEGRVDRGRSLWTLLSLEIWHRLFVDDDGSEAAAGRLGAGLMGAKKGRELW